MSGKASRTSEYLHHMLEACRRISRYVEGLDQAAFEADTRTQDAAIHNLEVIGEAARNVLDNDPEFAAAHAEIPWAIAYRMRNALSHGYATVSLPTVWLTISEHIPMLERQLADLLAEGPGHTSGALK